MLKALAVLLLLAAAVSAQPTSVSTVLPWSATYTPTYMTGSGQSVTLNNSILGIYTYTGTTANLMTGANANAINSATNYPINGGTFTSLLQVASSINSSIATALSVIPLASPASGVITKTDPATGAPLEVDSTLGPIFVERAETIGKHKFFIGITYQDYHFTSLNGHSLNGASVLYPGGQPSGVSLGGANVTTEPATFNFGLDVRLSQDVAFLTYGITDHLDVSVGLPMVHAAEASRTYDATLYTGDGLGHPNCWCVNTFTPGALSIYDQQVGQASSMSKTGLGDVLFRVKDTVYEKTNAAVALGIDVRAPTGDAANYLGTGAASAKPFAAVSLYNKTAGNLVFAPHFYVGWQFSGSSTLGGVLQGTEQTATIGTSQYTYLGAPFTSTKGTLPDVLSWAVGSEIAIGRHNTLIVDVLGNEIGLINGAINPAFGSVPNANLPAPPNTLGATATAQGFVCQLPSGTVGNATTAACGGKTSFGQYAGAFGYKARVVGNLVLSFNALVRFDNNGLTARFVPMYGLGYSF